MIEHMFETLFVDVPDDALVGVIEQLAEEEARLGARRLAAIAELVHRTVDEDDERGLWAFDPWDGTAARVAAALNVGHRRASGQMRIARALRDRLPQVAALYCRGVVSSRVVSEITWRTHLVDSDELIAVIDAALAEKAQPWGTLSEAHLERAIDAVIERHDPEAVRRSRELTRTRDLQIGASDDPSEITALWGRMLAADAAVLERRITAMVGGVCEADPRSVGERRSDALGALANGNDHLTCRCAAPNCAATKPTASSIGIRVIADQAAVDAARALIAAEDAERRRKSTNPPAPDESSPAPDELAVSGDSGLALLPGRGVMPTVVIAEALRGGAKVAPLRLPGPDPEPAYRPSTRLAEFIRLRDMFCRFPGCDVPAERCDLDHVIPWPWGPTHASNMNCKCRTHHLMKTFLRGPGGWRDEQEPDGRVTWTAPDGRVYTTDPGSRLYFPKWNITTADLPPPASVPPSDAALRAMMPRRRRTRAADEAARIKAERALNNWLLAVTSRE